MKTLVLLVVLFWNFEGSAYQEVITQSFQKSPHNPWVTAMVNCEIVKAHMITVMNQNTEMFCLDGRFYNGPEN